MRVPYTVEPPSTQIFVLCWLPQAGFTGLIVRRTAPRSVTSLFMQSPCHSLLPQILKGKYVFRAFSRRGCSSTHSRAHGNAKNVGSSGTISAPVFQWEWWYTDRTARDPISNKPAITTREQNAKPKYVKNTERRASR